MLNLWESELQRRVQAVLDELRTNALLLDALLPNVPTDVREQIREVARRMRVERGFPLRRIEVPTVAIVEGDSQEDPELQVIGMDVGEGWSGTGYRHRWDFYCLADNAAVQEWMGALIRYALLKSRPELTDMGLYDQAIGSSDVAIDLAALPDYGVFRVIRLVGKSFESYPLATTTPAAVTVDVSVAAQ